MPTTSHSGLILDIITLQQLVFCKVVRGTSSFVYKDTGFAGS